MTPAEQAKALDRIHKLLRLATNNPNEDEARSAALQAVKLIQQHGAVVAFAAVAKPRHAPTVSPDDMSEADQMWRQARAQERQSYGPFGGDPSVAQQRAEYEQRAAAARAERGQTPDGRNWWQKADWE